MVDKNEIKTTVNELGRLIKHMVETNTDCGCYNNYIGDKDLIVKIELVDKNN